MTRPECPYDVLIVTYLDQFERCGEVNGILRLKWILATTETSQMNEDQIVFLATQEKNKTL